MMRVRVKFSKYGMLKFIGHLDVMRYFQKAIRRAEIDVAYSKGFSPHQVMSFASPLGIGITSDGEYMDLELNSDPFLENKDGYREDCHNHGCGRKNFLERLNAVMTEGFEVTDMAALPEPRPNQRKETAMSVIAAADYKLTLRNPKAISRDGIAVSKAELQTLFQEFLNRETIEIIKKTKKNEQVRNLRPFIYGYGMDAEEFSDSIHRPLEEVLFGERHADVCGDAFCIYLRLCSGSVENIKPELAIEAFFRQYELECQEFGMMQHRMEQYRAISQDGIISYLPLSAVIG